MFKFIYWVPFVLAQRTHVNYTFTHTHNLCLECNFNVSEYCICIYIDTVIFYIHKQSLLCDCVHFGCYGDRCRGCHMTILSHFDQMTLTHNTQRITHTRMNANDNGLGHGESLDHLNCRTYMITNRCFRPQPLNNIIVRI